MSGVLHDRPSADGAPRLTAEPRHPEGTQWPCTSEKWRMSSLKASLFMFLNLQQAGATLPQMPRKSQEYV